MKSPLDLIGLWVVLCTVTCAGTWALSAVRGLNLIGYAGLAAVLAVIVSGFVKETPPGAWRRNFRKIVKRRRRILPVLFFASCAISFIGGLFSPVTLGDTIGYRLPRILHWLSENRWHWIHTGDERLNVVGLNAEFLWAPILMVTHQQWTLFPVIFIGYIFLPGLVFSFLRMVGVRGRVAWWWMWLLPAGYIYAMQAASTGTDSFSATAALAAVVFALRGVRRNRIEDLWISLLAYGFMTGIKQVTLPLTIIWIVPMLAGGARILLRKPVRTALVTLVAVTASALPIIIANSYYTGSWKGFSSDNHYEQRSAFWGLVGNLFTIPAQNLQPPIFPQAEAWNEKIAKFCKTPLGSHFNDFEVFAAMYRAVSEQNAGLGLGLSLLLIATMLALATNRGRARPVALDLPTRLIHWMPFIAASAFMAKSGLMQNARYMAPYYPFLLPVLLSLPANAIVVRRQWWKTFGVATALLTIGLLAISRQRPLIPPVMVDIMAARMPHNRLVKKAQNAYAFTRQNQIVERELARLIPVSATRIGYSAIDGLKEFELWRGAPGRKISWVTINDDATTTRGLEYVVVEPSMIERLPNKSIEDWRAKFGGGGIVGTIEVKRLPEAPPETTFVLKMR